MMLSRSFTVRRESGSIVHRHHRAAMTLVELLTALGITILLAAIAVPAVLSVIRGDRLRDASSSVQGFITAARERAALDNRPRGVRLIPDPDNPELVRQLIMIREADPIAPGGSLYGGAIVSNYFSQNVVAGPVFYDTVEINYDPQFVNALTQSQTRGKVYLSRYSATPVLAVRGVLRIGSAGPFRAFSYFPENPNWNSRGTTPPRTLLILDEPLPVPIGADLDVGGTLNLAASGVGVEISRPPVPLEGVDRSCCPKELSSISANSRSQPIQARSLRQIQSRFLSIRQTNG